jgi:hypothetical protein
MKTSRMLLVVATFILTLALVGDVYTLFMIVNDQNGSTREDGRERCFAYPC